jgi:acyl carrier protein
MSDMDREQIISELETLLEISPGTLKEEEEVRKLKHWDSLKLLEIIAFADEELHIQVDANRLAECAKIGDILKLLQDTIVASRPPE